MRRSILAIAVVLPLVGGCATIPFASIVQQVQQITTQACAFLPTAETIIDIFLSGDPRFNDAKAVAAAICNAVVQPSALRATAPVPPHVGNIPVYGRFVR